MVFRRLWGSVREASRAFASHWRKQTPQFDGQKQEWVTPQTRESLELFKPVGRERSWIKSNKAKKKILVLFAGGTIAMKKGAKGLEPGLKPEDLYKLFPEVKRHADIDTHFITDVDSSDIEAKHLEAMCDAIHKNQDKYDGVMILHGTDTMDNTAAAISYAFGNTLKIPVMITGAMRHPQVLRSDARTNIHLALKGLLTTTRPEVMLAFHDKIFRGSRAMKISESNMEGFGSPAVPPLAQYYSTGLKWFVPRNPAVPAKTNHQYLPFFHEHVHDIKLRSARKASFFTQALLALSKIQKTRLGLNLISLGSGNIANSYHPAIKMAQDTNTPVIVSTAFPGADLNMLAYKAGREALELGVIPAGDMTDAAASTKLSWAIGVGHRLIGSGQLEEKNLINFVRELIAKPRAREVTRSPLFKKSMQISRNAGKAA